MQNLRKEVPILLFSLIMLAALSSFVSADHCSDIKYVLANLDECAMRCGNNNYALNHPEECADPCADNEYALEHQDECNEPVPVVGCEDNAYALEHQDECADPCDNNAYALDHPVECGTGCGDGICLEGEKGGWCPSDCPVPVVGCEDNAYALEHQDECADNCDNNAYALTHPELCGTPVTCEEKFIDSYRCSGNDRQREKQMTDCTTKWVTLGTCQYGCKQVWASPTLPVGCESAPEPGPGPAADNAPSATISVPSSALPSSSMSISVSGTDDLDVAELRLFDSAGTQIGSFICAGTQTTCSNTFTATAPSTAGASYSFSARSVDSAGQLSALVSGSGATAVPAGDNPPSTAITVPSSAAPSSSLSISVSGTDDLDVAELRLFDSAGTQIASFSCSGTQTTCSNTFTATAPSTFSTAYAFSARSVDSAGQLSALVSGSGITSAATTPASEFAAPAVPAVAVPGKPKTIFGKVARLNRISATADDSAVSVTTSFETARKLSDAKVVVSLPELGTFAKRNVVISGAGRKTVSVLLPFGDGFAGEIEEFVRVVFHSDEGRRIKYVPLGVIN